MIAMIRLLMASLSMIVVSGCVVGQSLPTTYAASPAATTKAGSASGSGSSVIIKVTDDRPFVKNGEKPPYYLGKYRSGFGIPWDVETDNDEPLASIIARDLATDLAALGHVVRTEAPSDRLLAVSIRDLNFDGYQNGRIWYDLQITVSNAGGTPLATNVVQEASHVKGTFWKGARGGFEREMPRVYSQIINKIARENETILAAL